MVSSFDRTNNHLFLILIICFHSNGFNYFCLTWVIQFIKYPI